MATTVPNSVFSQIYSQDIKDKLFESNAFLNTFTNVSSYLTGRIVHIPNYTNTPTIYVDGQSEAGATYDYGFTTTATQEADLQFTINSYRINSFRVENFDEAVTQYDKYQAVTRNSIGALSERVGKYMLRNLAASATGTSVTTTGSAGSANGPASSSKKKTTAADIISLQTLFNQQNVPNDGRYLILNPTMYSELLQDPAVLNQYAFGTPNLPSGVVREVAGFNIMIKPTIATQSSGGTINALGATDLSTDSYCGLAYVATSIAAAWSEPKVFTGTQVPQIYGDTVSAEINMGVALSRTDGKGLAKIVQG